MPATAFFGGQFFGGEFFSSSRRPSGNDGGFPRKWHPFLGKIGTEKERLLEELERAVGIESIQVISDLAATQASAQALELAAELEQYRVDELEKELKIALGTQKIETETKHLRLLNLQREWMIEELRRRIAQDNDDLLVLLLLVGASA